MTLGPSNLETLLEEEGAILFIFFTGDAAQSGKSEEYDEVTDFFGAESISLRELGLLKSDCAPERGFQRKGGTRQLAIHD